MLGAAAPFGIASAAAAAPVGIAAVPIVNNAPLDAASLGAATTGCVNSLGGIVACASYV